MAAVRLDRVSKRFDDGSPAVRDLDLDVADGEFLVLAGPPRCGNSTVLRIIAGLEEISSGTLHIDGRVANTVSARDRDVALVFQSYALYPHMSVADNISYGLRIRGVDQPEIDRRVKRAAELLELGPLLDQRPKRLPGVERQRVALGRSIVRQPRVFLMDEPLASLDATLRARLHEDIVRVQRELRITTIYATHDQAEARTMGDRLAVLRDGRLHQAGEPGHLHDHPGDVVVAGFLGTPPMNLVRARVTADGRAVLLGAAPLPLPPALTGHGGREVVLGVRPEDLTDTSGGGVPADRPRLRATALVVEAAGPATIVHFGVATPQTSTAAVRLVARFAAGSPVRPGDDIEMAVDPGRLHVFDAETGLAAAQ